jgi:predicted AAA+ superfamily ATPase
MINRIIRNKIEQLSNGFPVIVVTGPRQAGKTTLIKNLFPEYGYYNLESPQTLALIESDPVGFIKNLTPQTIIDEVQRAPDLLSYIQVEVDEKQRMGAFILSGSENILLSEKVNQSLAGRAAYVQLLPLSVEELVEEGESVGSMYDQLFTGFFPALYSRDIQPVDYYDQYIATYVERDVKQISNIINLAQFRKFLGLLAGRIGQVVNLSSLANDVGVAPNTIENWLSLLEASYLILRLQPYYENLGKRYIKSPKIYFTDTGLACRLLGLSSASELPKHFLIGGLFENMVILEIKKHILNHGKSAQLYYFRDTNGNEIDLLIDQGLTQIPIEIKSSSTFSTSFIKGISFWTSLMKESNKKTLPGSVIYAGDESHQRDTYDLLNWRSLSQLYEKIR